MNSTNRKNNADMRERQVHMGTYKIDPIASKIKAPIVCKVEDKELSFATGEELAAYTFEKPFLIDTIEINDNKAVITLKERYGFDEKWIKEHVETYGHEPNMFDGA